METDNEKKKWPVTVEKAAALSGFTVSALKTKCARGQIPYYRPFGGGTIVIDMVELNDILTQNRKVSTEDLESMADEILKTNRNRRRKGGKA